MINYHLSISILIYVNYHFCLINWIYHDSCDYEVNNPYHMYNGLRTREYELKDDTWSVKRSWTKSMLSLSVPMTIGH